MTDSIHDVRDRQVVRETLADLVRDEGFRGSPYRCSEDVLTVGYGTIFPISKAEADWLLEHRYHLAVNELSAAMFRAGLPTFGSLPVRVRRALGNMVYQLGVPRLIGFRRMFAAIRAGDWTEAHAEALDSRWARQQPKRAKRVAALLLPENGTRE